MIHGQTIVIETKQFLLSKRFWGWLIAIMPLLAQFMTGPTLKLDVASLGGLMLNIYGAWIANAPLSLTGQPQIIVPPPTAG